MANDRLLKDPLAPLLETLAAAGTEATMAPDDTIEPLKLAAQATLAAAEAPRQRPSEVAREAARSLPPLPHLTIGTLTEAAGEGARLDLVRSGLLGEGGMGRVELARQHSLARDVAVKSVRPDLVSVAAVSSLLKEARFTGSLEHPNIIPVHALGHDDAGLPLLVMKRVDGVVWRTLLREIEHPRGGGARGEDLVRHLEILMQVCNAVHFAHTRGVVHRDLKPENVMVGEFGEVYVLDWGLAVDLGVSPGARSPALAGTPKYMAPEMLQGETEVTPRTDVFLLGAMLHEILTGRARHEGATLGETLRAVAEVKPYPYEAPVPEELAALANRATHAKPEERVPSAAAFREALGDFLRHRGSITLAEEAGERLAALGRLLAGPEDEERRHEIHRLALECRFGFRQALRIWEGNPRAHAGLETCLVMMIEYELGRQNPGAAEALFHELPVPQPALAARIEAQKEERRKAEGAAAELARLAYEQDLGVSARQRIIALGLIVLTGMGMSITLAIQDSPEERATAGELVTLGGIIMGVTLVTVLLGRRALLATQINRKFTVIFVTCVTAVFGHRLLARHLGMQVPHILLGDLVTITTMLIASAISLMPRVLWIAALPIGAMVATALWPERALRIFETTALASLLGMLGVVMFSVRSQRGGRSNPG